MTSGVDGLKFLPQLWLNFSVKMTKTRSVHVLKLDSIALNNSCWINWQKCSKLMHFAKIVLASEILTPTELGSVGAPQHHCI